MFPTESYKNFQWWLSKVEPPAPGSAQEETEVIQEGENQSKLEAYEQKVPKDEEVGQKLLLLKDG